MTMPPPGGRVDTSVSQDEGFQLAQGFDVLVAKLGSLERVIGSQTAMLERTINASMRYSMAGQAPIKSSVLKDVAAAGGGVGWASTSMTAVTGMGALSSTDNLRAYAAQQLGSWIAGMPLYEAPGGSSGPGGTPVGTPSSAAAPGGAGAQAAAAAAAKATGAPAPNAPVAPGRLTGLPALMWGAGTRGAGGGPSGTSMTALKVMGARVAMSGGGLGGIAGALRHLPGVGLLMDAIGGVADFYQSQREAGRIYQEVEGGSNLSAQTERLHALAYQASMYGRMPSGAAAQAFGAVTALGYNQAAVGEGQQPQNRQSALDFIYHNYTASGMSVDQSLAILQTASKNAVIELGGVSEALKTLSDTAGQAGTNANTARQEFNSYFQAAIGQGYGAGAPAIAGGLAAMQASYGKEFAGVNFGGELSQRRQYLLAGMAGITPAQLQYIARTQPGEFNRMLAGQNMQFLTAGGMMNPAMMTSLRQMITAAGGTGTIMSNPSVRDQIANQFLNQWQVKGNINLDLWAQEISAMTGVPIDANHVMQWIVDQTAGVNEASHNRSLPGTGRRTGPRTGRYGLAQGTRGSMQGVSSRYSGSGGQSWQDVLRSHAGTAAQAYLAAEGRTGRRSPVLEGLLQNLSQSDHVQVRTRAGMRVMSLTDAMKYYPDELAQGNVEFYGPGGAPLGDTSAVTHGLADTGARTTAELSQRAGSRHGVPMAAWQRQFPGSAPAAGGRGVTVDLTQEARQLLKLLPGNYDQAAATSSVPANPWPSQASR